MDGIGLLAGFLLFTILGLVAGCLTGLAPGLHINNVAALVVANPAAWFAVLSVLVAAPPADPTTGGLLLSCFLMAAAASHAVFEFIPTVFLGAPTEATALATQPGHRLLSVGQGAKAVAMAARGALLGTGLAVVVLIPLRLLLSDPIRLAETFRPWTPAFIVFVLGAMVASDLRGRGRARRATTAIWVQVLAGLLGIAALRGPFPLDSSAVLFPLFSGLFGVPSLLIGLRSEPGQFPPQRLEPLGELRRNDVGHIVRGAVAGACVSWLPGLSGGAASALASIGTRRMGPSQFMVLLGATSASTGLLSVAVLFMIRRARSGAAAAVRALIGDVPPWSEAGSVPGSLFALLIAAVLATSIAAPLATRLGRFVARRWSGIDPRRLNLISLGLLAGLISIATGAAGVALAALAAVVGLVPIALRVRRIHLMASLLVPVLASYLWVG